MKPRLRQRKSHAPDFSSRTRRARSEGRLFHLLAVIIVAGIYNFSANWFPLPGAHQSFALPQFQMLAFSIENSIRPISEELNQARKFLPSAEKTNFSGTELGVVQNQLLELKAFILIASLRARASAYLGVVSRDFYDQHAIGIISNDEYLTIHDQLAKIQSLANQNLDCMQEVQRAINTLEAGLQDDSKVIEAKVLSIKDIVRRVEGASTVERCLPQSNKGVDETERLIVLHDRKVNMFNQRASLNLERRELFRSLLAITMYVLGRGALSYLLKIWRSVWPASKAPVKIKLSNFWRRAKMKRFFNKKRTVSFW